MILPLEIILNFPIGERLSSDNWESFVYALGNDWVYKEVKTEKQLPPETPDYWQRYHLQRFWCSDTHFKNAKHDLEVCTQALGEWLPRTYLLRAPARFSDNPNAIVTIQQQSFGRLLSELPMFTSDSLERLTTAVSELANHHLNAPLDFHPGNIMLDPQNGKVQFFDTGTPSDWTYLTDPNRLHEAIDIGHEDAEVFAAYMRVQYENHRRKSGME